MKLIKVYVVMEEDRGMGADVQGVFQDKEQAEELAERSSHLFIEESFFYAMDLVDENELLKQRNEARELAEWMREMINPWAECDDTSFPWDKDQGQARR